MLLFASRLVNSSSISLMISLASMRVSIIRKLAGSVLDVELGGTDAADGEPAVVDRTFGAHTIWHWPGRFNGVNDDEEDWLRQPAVLRLINWVDELFDNAFESLLAGWLICCCCCCWVIWPCVELMSEEADDVDCMSSTSFYKQTNLNVISQKNEKKINDAQLPYFGF